VKRLYIDAKKFVSFAYSYPFLINRSLKNRSNSRVFGTAAREYDSRVFRRMEHESSVICGRLKTKNTFSRIIKTNYIPPPSNRSENFSGPTTTVNDEYYTHVSAKQFAEKWIFIFCSSKKIV